MLLQRPWLVAPSSSFASERPAQQGVPRRGEHGRRRAHTVAAERSAAPGDLVTVRLTSENEAVAASVASEEPLMFQLGSDGIMGNELFQVIDKATRGLKVGDKSDVELKSPDWNPELLFEVALSHPEVERLEGRYKNQGGLKQGAVVELANGATAVVLEKSEESVIFDANSPFASQPASLQLELLGIEDGEEAAV
ncbi:hypothetical protein WJX73_008600 [Symbiochloris irregularis]|uniref:Peptidylprolyl isomerase n=1 Tax=Symbiochloris irregularis TaxID=706552 RepID=A0AAW1NQP9_9CHLO